MPRPLSRVRTFVRDQHSAYAGDAERPLGGYLTFLTAYSGLVVGLGTVVRVTGRELPDGLSPWDVVCVAAATHKVARVVTKAPVTSPLRAPFTAYTGVSGSAELAEEVRGHGVRHAVGELLTCPFCISQWIATGFVSGLVFAPRAARVAAGLFTALAGADLLQYVHAGAEQAV